ncbi:MAG: hypothetical protein GXO76_15545 [Calditrichaeota bacterium]|nr:hypothetical protein [Calditrichota bacterium]
MNIRLFAALVGFVAWGAIFPRISYAQDKPSKIHPVGWIDQNHDGINDLFRDANGDGINDVTKKPYPHTFRFVDANKDGTNDVFIDADGDGVNDLIAEHKNLIPVIDADHDGKNDITGQPYSPKNWGGGKYGFWDEQKGRIQMGFVDENGDGIDDRMAAFKEHRKELGKNHHKMKDRFIDEDGDGISDMRMDRIRIRMRHMGKHRGHRP